MLCSAILPAPYSTCCNDTGSPLWFFCPFSASPRQQSALTFTHPSLHLPSRHLQPPKTAFLWSPLPRQQEITLSWQSQNTCHTFPCLYLHWSALRFGAADKILKTDWAVTASLILQEVRKFLQSNLFVWNLTVCFLVFCPSFTASCPLFLVFSKHSGVFYLLIHAQLE